MGALSGVRVLDLGHYYAGPLAALLLAEQGAEVIHVDRPRSAPLPAEQDAFLNRSKQRRTLDMKSAAGRLELQQLAAQCDVLIENFRPGVLPRHGFGAEALRALNPDMIYCSLPGFSARDARANVPGWEGVVSAAAGLYCQHSPAGKLADGAAPYCDFPLASNFAAMQAATAIVMALIARQRGAGGQWIEAPLFDCAVELLGPATPADFPNYTIINGGGIYPCASGHIFFNANNPRFLFWLLDALGVTTSFRDAGLLEPSVLTNQDAAGNSELRRRLQALFAGRDAADWENLAALHHVPLTRVRTCAEWMQSPMARSAGSVCAIDDPELGRLLQPQTPVQLSVDCGAARHPRRVPDGSALPIHGFTARPPVARPAAKPGSIHQALQGIQVLDLAAIIAGPSVGRWLADFGAEVYKINDPNTNQVALHDYLNRGKRSVLLDVSRPAGRAAILRMAERCDVWLSNFPEPTLQRYALSEDSVRSCSSNIVYATVSCYGAEGEWSARRGYEPQAQSCSGIMARYGSPNSPVMLPYLLNDYGTGVLGALAVGLALYARCQHGRGQRVSVSLAHTATWHQWGATPATAERRLYRAADRWIFIHADAARAGDLRTLLAPQLRADADDALRQRHYAARLAERTAAEWQQECTALGIAAMPLATHREVLQDVGALARGVSLPARPRLSGTLEHPGMTVHLSATPKRQGEANAQPGADMNEVFTAMDMNDLLPELLQAGLVQPQLRQRLTQPG